MGVMTRIRLSGSNSTGFSGVGAGCGSGWGLTAGGIEDTAGCGAGACEGAVEKADEGAAGLGVCVGAVEKEDKGAGCAGAATVEANGIEGDPKGVLAGLENENPVPIFGA